MTDSTGSEPKMTTGLSAGAWLRGLLKVGALEEWDVLPPVEHSHEYETYTDAEGPWGPFECRACAVETGDPYAWVDRG